ncbi:hypothetical protein T01_5414, partial [Trichinella spiralis]
LFSPMINAIQTITVKVFENVASLLLEKISSP